MTTLLVVIAILVAVVVLLGLALASADRLCLALTERKAAEYLAGPFGHRPTVRVHGRPFLVQALRGRYADIEVSGERLQVGEIAGATFQARVTDAMLPLREVLSGRTTQLPCGAVDGRLVLPYAELSRVSRIPGLALGFEDGRLIASASLPVPGINQLTRVTGLARLVLVESVVWLQVRGLSVAGISLPSLVVKQLLPSLNVPIPLPVLPYGLRVLQLHPEAAGLVVMGSAHDVVFEALS